MADKEDDDLFGGLQEELDEWDKMFDSIHATEAEANETPSAPAPEQGDAAVPAQAASQPSEPIPTSSPFAEQNTAGLEIEARPFADPEPPSLEPGAEGEQGAVRQPRAATEVAEDSPLAPAPVLELEAEEPEETLGLFEQAPGMEVGEFELGAAGATERLERSKILTELVDLGPSGRSPLEMAPVDDAGGGFEDSPFEDQRTRAGGASLSEQLAAMRRAEESRPVAPVEQEAEPDLLVERAEAIGPLLGAKPDDAGSSGLLTSARLPSTVSVRADEARTQRQGPMGPEDAALDDVSAPHAPRSALSDAARSELDERAAAFFGDDEGQEVSLELDDDFYADIEVGGADDEAEETPADAPERMPFVATTESRKGRAHVVRRKDKGTQPGELFSSQAADEHEASTAVRDLSSLADVASSGEGSSVVEAEIEAGLPPLESGADDAIAEFDEAAGDATVATANRSLQLPVPDDVAIPVPVEPAPTAGFGVLRTSPDAPGEEDSVDLKLEVDSAIDEMFTGGEAALEIEAEEPDASEFDGLGITSAEFRPSDPMDGVVESAFDDAVAMSTGTLHTGPNFAHSDVEPDLPEARFRYDCVSLDLDALQLPEDLGLDEESRTDEYAKRLVQLGREIELIDESDALVRLRIEAARLSEALGDVDEARYQLDEALKLDPRLSEATRALRRIERSLGNWEEVLNQLDKDMGKATSMEARALAGYRADMLVAMGEMDLARVAAGDLLDSAPTDTRALLANLELAFVDGRGDEVQEYLDRLVAAVSDDSLRSSLGLLRASLLEEEGKFEAAASAYGESAGLGAALGGAILADKRGGDAPAPTSPAEGALGLAWGWVYPQAQEAEQPLDELPDPERALDAISLLRRARRKGDVEATRRAAGWLLQAGLGDGLSSFCANSISRGAEDHAQAANYLIEVARHYPEDFYLRERLREELIAAEQFESLAQLDSATVMALDNDAAALARAATSAARAGEFEQAIELGRLIGDEPTAQLSARRAAAKLGDHGALATLWQELASSAVGSPYGEQALRAIARARTRLSLSGGASLADAAEEWSTLVDLSASNRSALRLSHRLSLLDDEATHQEGSLDALLSSEDERSLRIRAGVESALGALADPSSPALEDVCLRLLGEAPEPSLSELLWLQSLHRDAPADAARFQESAYEGMGKGPGRYERAYRAASLRIHGEEDAEAGRQILRAIGEELPEFHGVRALLGTQGSAASTTRGASGDTGRVELDDVDLSLRRAEALQAAGEEVAAMELITALRAEHPANALVRHGFKRIMGECGGHQELASVALAELRSAEESKDAAAKVEACMELARIDGELRGDRDSALMFWESASRSAPDRADLQQVLLREYQQRGDEKIRSREMLALYGRMVASLSSSHERSAMLLERARLARAMDLDEQASDDYEAAYEEDPSSREALMFLEAKASARGPSEELAELEAAVAASFGEDRRARAAFLVRSGETLRSLGRGVDAISRLREAVQLMPGYAPALFAWRELALDEERWEELALVCLSEAESVSSDSARVRLYHLAGVTLMEHCERRDLAVESLRKVLAIDPLHRDAFVRLRRLYDEAGDAEELAQLFSMRIAVEEDRDILCELHHARATVLQAFLDNPSEALEHLRSVLQLRPSDPVAIEGVARLSWEQGQWAEAADALMSLARIEKDPEELKDIFFRLGQIYSEHIPDPKWAMRSFQKVVQFEPSNRDALERLAELAFESQDYRLALGASEKLVKLDPPADEKIRHLHRIAVIFLQGFKDANKAERALRIALDIDPRSEDAFGRLMDFYRGQGSERSAHVYADRVAASMRKEIGERPVEAGAYQVLARAMDARVKAGAPEAAVVARCAAELALLFGGEKPELASILARKVSPRVRGLCTEELDDLLLPRNVDPGFLAVFRILGDRLAKHLGIDVRRHGVGRGDKIKRGANPIIGPVVDMLPEMGVEDVDFYLSPQKKRVLAAESTHPLSIIVGEELASLERPDELRFLVGRCAKLGQTQLASALQVGEERFGVLIVGLLRLFKADFLPSGVVEEEVQAEQQRLKRLIPSGVLQELTPYALSLASSDFDHRVIWAGLTDLGNRAGLLCAGSAEAAMRALMRLKGISSTVGAMQDPEIATLMRFAMSADHLRLYKAIGEQG